MKKIIWLDDVRDPSRKTWRDYILAHTREGEVVWVKNRTEFEEAVSSLGKEGIQAIFFDNDLGVPGKDQEGRHCFRWLYEKILEEGWGRIGLFCQSSNPVASIWMSQGFKDLDRYWEGEESSSVK